MLSLQNANRSLLSKINRQFAFYTSIIALSFLALTGCQSTIKSQGLITSSVYWQGMQERLQSIQFIELAGRVNFAHQGDRFSSNFRYKGKDAHNYELILTTSFGNLIGHLTVTPHKAYLQTDKHRLEADSAQELFANSFNIPLPLNHFHSIIMGIALQDDGHSLFSNAGFVTNSSVGQFTINYLDYQSVEDISIPSNFEITAPDLHIVVVSRDIYKIERKE